MSTLGVVVGEFHPPHRGDKLRIEAARRQVDRLVVLVAAHPSHPIPGELRAAWLREIHPDCDVRLEPDELPDDSEARARWAVHSWGRAPDMVFTSEDYGEPYARAMGAKPVSVDCAVPVSASRLRAAPLDHLDFLEPCVRAWFVRRVVVVGAESTGKTTLAARLAARFRTEWVPEYAREHWEEKVRGLSTSEPPPSWTPAELLHIAEEQQRRENLAARRANRVLICDTNAFATGTWHERYRGHRDPQVDAVGARDRVHAFLLAAPDVPFVQDGFRDGEKIRRWMHERFLEQLKGRTTPLFLLEGPWERRERDAIGAVEALLRAPFDGDLGAQVSRR